MIKVKPTWEKREKVDHLNNMCETLVHRTLASSPSLGLCPLPTHFLHLPNQLLSLNPCLVSGPTSGARRAGQWGYSSQVHQKQIDLTVQVHLQISCEDVCPLPPHLHLYSCSSPKMRNRHGRTPVYAIKKVTPTYKRKVNMEVTSDIHSGSQEHDRNCFHK